MHILPQLRELEQRYADTLTVVGVHSAKFPQEQATEAVAQAVRRHAIHHPVVNDHDFAIWQQYGVRAWPTLMFVDPLGKVIGKHEGEFAANQLAPIIDRMLEEFGANDWLDRRVLDFGATGPAAQTGPAAATLAFPGKVAADERGNGHVYVADSNHHRLVVTGLRTLDGSVHHVIGSGEPGLRDGPAPEAQFHWPQGMAVDPVTGTVYVADTENHAIRRVSPATGAVTTIAGTGKQARSFGGGGPALQTDLSSPWDVALLPDPARTATAGGGANTEKQDYPDRGLLFIAMAGLHQIWALDLANGTVAPFAGSGREDILDGLRQEACFAQPSGLALNPAANVLYVADSETSAIRAIHLDSEQVETVVGTGLFDFGDTDARGERVRLQHPLAVCRWPTAPDDPALLVADTYNHKIKRLNPRTREATTLLGAPGSGAHTDGVGTAARFSEPGGLALARGKLFVADTNNHALRVVDLATLDTTTIPLDEARRAHPEHT